MRPFLQQSFDSAIEAKRQAACFGKGEEAPLHLGISATVEIQTLLPALHQLARAMPGLKLHLLRKPAFELMQELERGDIELCVTAIADVTWERIDQWPLFTENFVLVVGTSHALGEADSINLSQLAGRNVITRPYCEQADFFAGILKERNIETNSRHELSDQFDLAAIIGGGLGIGITPESATIPDNAVSIPIGDLPMQRTVSLFAVSGRRYSLAASGFIRLLRAADWSQQDCQDD